MKKVNCQCFNFPDYSDDFEVYDSLEEPTGHAWQEDKRGRDPEIDEEADLETVRNRLFTVLSVFYPRLKVLCYSLWGQLSILM